MYIKYLINVEYCMINSENIFVSYLYGILFFYVYIVGIVRYDLKWKLKNLIYLVFMYLNFKILWMRIIKF